MTKRLAAGAILVALSALPAEAGEPGGAPASTWTGYYVGGHLGYTWGTSDWAGRTAGGEASSGSLDFFLAYDAFKGTGSYFSGFQAGYNYKLPSGVLLGFEADVSAPNTTKGSQTFASPAIGQASYEEKVEYSGTVRGRLGYVRNDWLVYATAGYAWTYDLFTRTQLAGTPAGGTAIPGTAETSHALRSGWAAGAGVEVPVAAHWTATLEYLFTAFGTHAVAFPAGAQRFESDLALQSVRLGLNYQFGDDRAKERTGPAPPKSDDWSVHAQTTYVYQYAFPFRSPYAGPNSLAPAQGRETWDATFYVGWRVWRGAELWINPEIDQGFGLSGTLGVAGFTSGEAYKLGSSYPYTRLPRTFLRQTIDLGGESEKVEAGINQLAGTQTANRVVLTVGKFAVTDIFDGNKYAHDARSDFLNWALIDTATFDYASDAWGYTYGAAVEWYRGPWTLRGGFFDLPITPNNTQLDPSFAQNQWVGEIERRYKLRDQPGKLAITGYPHPRPHGDLRRRDADCTSRPASPRTSPRSVTFRTNPASASASSNSSPPSLGSSPAPAWPAARRSRLPLPMSIARLRQDWWCPASYGGGPTIRSASAASSTASPARMRLFSTPAVSASSSATASCPTRGPKRSSRCTTASRSRPGV